MNKRLLATVSLTVVGALVSLGLISCDNNRCSCTTNNCVVLNNDTPWDRSAAIRTCDDVKCVCEADDAKVRKSPYFLDALTATNGEKTELWVKPMANVNISNRKNDIPNIDQTFADMTVPITERIILTGDGSDNTQAIRLLNNRLELIGNQSIGNILDYGYGHHLNNSKFNSQNTR